MSVLHTTICNINVIVVDLCKLITRRSDCKYLHLDSAVIIVLYGESPITIRLYLHFRVR